MSDPTNNLVPIGQKGVAYPEEVRQRAFLYWMFECDSSPRKTAKLLVAREREEARLDGRPPRAMPDEQTISLWSRNDDWEAKRHTTLLGDGNLDKLYQYQMARLVLGFPSTVDKLLEIRDLPLEITRTNYDREGEVTSVETLPSPAIASILKSIELYLQTIRVLGHFQEMKPVEVKQPRMPRNTNETPTRDELIARQRERLKSIGMNPTRRKRA
jgi:hypothetical protein